MDGGGSEQMGAACAEPEPSCASLSSRNPSEVHRIHDKAHNDKTECGIGQRRGSLLPTDSRQLPLKFSPAHAVLMHDSPQLERCSVWLLLHGGGGSPLSHDITTHSCADGKHTVHVCRL